MSRSRIVIITGSPATGKSTVSDILAENSDSLQSVHMLTDDFYHYIKKGYVAPYLPEAKSQNEVVINAFLETTKVFSDNGYEVIVDGIIGPWFFNPWKKLAQQGYEVHYIVLRANKDVTMRRAIGRTKLDEDTNIKLVETMWEQFADVGEYENNVIDSTQQSSEETAHEIRCHIAKRDFII
ncbi:AAA family ATPase [Companilactobacillus hulinensis]|uniref:AAA family ATPase n=1 Tax=Companilactobacillus hulinensis TaxID=2486007 RepID=UPI000F765DFE|nr:AAA family ATPase [Companilactobacillus hulinensis]